MTQTPKKIHHDDDISKMMVIKINTLNPQELKEYKIRELVEDTDKLGRELVRKNLKTNQIRKFLDAVKRLKSKLDKTENRDFTVIKDELIFLHPQLAYAAAKQQKNARDLGPVAPFKQVLDAAIKQVKDPIDFDRFIQLVEAIIAYHKSAGGQDQ